MCGARRRGGRLGIVRRRRLGLGGWMRDAVGGLLVFGEVGGGRVGLGLGIWLGVP